MLSLSLWQTNLYQFSKISPKIVNNKQSKEMLYSCWTQMWSPGIDCYKREILLVIVIAMPFPCNALHDLVPFVQFKKWRSFFENIVKTWKLLSIFAKCAIIDVWKGPIWASGRSLLYEPVRGTIFCYRFSLWTIIIKIRG